MMIVLGILLLAARVSAEEQIQTFHGFLGDSIHLPCNCTDIDSTKPIQWQKEPPEEKSSLHRSNSTLFLANITEEHQGEYTCRFTRLHKSYYKCRLFLNISAKFNVCQKAVNDQSFQCDAEGFYERAEILWTLDGKILTNSSKVKIINSKGRRREDQPHRFKSKLISEFNITSNLKCSVQAGSMSPDITAFCKPADIPTRAPIKHENDWKYFPIIPFFLVLIIMVAGIAFIYSRRRVDKARHVANGHGPDSNLTAVSHGTPQEREILPTQDPAPEKETVTI